MEFSISAWCLSQIIIKKLEIFNMFTESHRNLDESLAGHNEAVDTEGLPQVHVTLKYIYIYENILQPLVLGYLGVVR